MRNEERLLLRLVFISQHSGYEQQHSSYWMLMMQFSEQAQKAASDYLSFGQGAVIQSRLCS
jgi:hypothetical protein